MAKMSVLWYNIISKGGGKMKHIEISSEYITIGQLLKYIGIVVNGGEIKEFLINNDVFLNNILVKERGKKVYPGSVVTVFGKTFLVKGKNVD